MKSTRDAFVGLGANMGDRLEVIEAAIEAIDDIDGTHVADVSGVYETAPVGGPHQDPYLNAVVRIEVALEPRALLAELQLIEAAFGRDRSREVRWGPRTVDLDILLYGDEQIDTGDLVVPHPRLHERAFALVPLLEVFPGGTLPDGRRLATLVSDLAPFDGVDLFVRLERDDHHPRRPQGPAGPGAVAAADWEPPVGPPPGVHR
ncbi:MAG TPA: 2-amino-4-hydroxy-6-hydroxymethyldihydropteridine diphosphokinase [Nitriliruptorales bacterium]